MKTDTLKQKQKGTGMASKHRHDSLRDEASLPGNEATAVNGGQQELRTYDPGENEDDARSLFARC